MLVDMAYGETGFTIEVPDHCTTVVQPTYVQGLAGEDEAISNAIRNPIGMNSLSTLVRSDQTVVISVPDITRPMPSKVVLGALFRELGHIPREQVTIIVATGTHRSNSPQELEAMLGEGVVSRYQVVNHDGFTRAGLKRVGDTVGGIPVWINRFWIEADFRITIGFVEPHFFAGFSGGPKMVAPGLAGIDTIMGLHSASLIGHPNSTWGVTYGNPIHDAIRAIACETGVDFSVDVTTNCDNKITSVHAGDLFAVHQVACQFSKRVVMCPVYGKFGLVITSNSGYPLDLNLYQSVKGMSAAAQVVQQEGTIICVSECRDGIPDHGGYRKILASRHTSTGLLDMINSPDYNHHDQWQVQVQAQIQLHSKVYLKSSYLSPFQVRSAHLEPVEDVQKMICDFVESHGSGARICVLPQGPQTIPYVN